MALPVRRRMGEANRVFFVRYGGALGVVVAATVLRLVLDPWLGTRFPFATLFAAVLISAWYGGFGPALFASGAGGLASAWFLLAPRHRFRIDDPDGVAGLVLYLAVSVGIAAIGGAMQRARSRAEAAARDATSRGEALRVTLLSIGDAVITTDVAGMVTTLNRVAEELTGWTTEAAKGRPLDEVWRIVDETTHLPVPNPAARVLAEGRVVGLANHTLLISRDGSERPIDDSAAPIRDGDGALLGVIVVFRDVSGRRAEERLRRSQQDLEDFFENSNVGLHELATDGTILRANRAELYMLGYERDEYVGHEMAEFHVDPSAASELMTRLVGGEDLVSQPAQLRCKDGSVKDVLVNSTAVRHEGRLLHTRGLTIDVTPARRAEEAQALLAAVVESSDDAIVTKTLDGIITSWNTGAERLWGWRADEVIGQPITSIIPPDRHDEERAILARLRCGEQIEPFDTVRLTKDGRPIDVSLRISPVRGAGGRIVGASKVARDVTASRRAEQALRESEERFRTLADNIAQFAWMADSTGSIFWYNRRWFEYTGTTLEQVQGWGWRAVHHPDHVARVVAKISRCFETGEVWEDTFPLRAADGSYRWFLSRAIPIRDAEGEVLRWFGTNTDVSAQRGAEEALKEADRRKDEFLATLAHELRNPLAPLASWLEILKGSGGDSVLLEHAHAAMKRQLVQLGRLVDDLLDVARISHDHIELRREPLTLDSVLEQALETCRPTAQAAGVDLSVGLPAEPIHLHADAVRLAQVFGNLLSNACKFTEPGGRIRLEARREGAQVAVSVRDTGRGIRPDLLPRVFEMFTRLGMSPERPAGGLGIGLTLVRRLVELHGGTVQGFSEGEGRGSEFLVRLPLLRAPHVSSADPPPEETLHAKPRRVLLVDDNADAAEALAILLRRSGHDVTLAYDGDAALDAAKSAHPDVVLLDIGLPQLSGHDVARRIRSEPWGRSILMVALTGWGQAEDRRRSREAGFDHHLVKPIDSRELLRLLARLTELEDRERPSP